MSFDVSLVWHAGDAEGILKLGVLGLYIYIYSDLWLVDRSTRFAWFYHGFRDSCPLQRGLQACNGIYSGGYNG
jgi:hypothetical protein